ncbi:MAG: hypothetical protein HY270_03470, partial [Deltaproteobacteria bacterium]|nr:hypothetical protein [Deltaproteobacteria bacterium]
MTAIRFVQPLSVWVKVAICLVAIELVLFDAKIFWWFTPDFSREASNATWSQVYQVAREFETRPERPGTAWIVGDSIVLTGIDQGVVAADLSDKRIRAEVMSVAAYGTSVTDAALMVWGGRRLAPWLVIYGIEAHNFKRPGGFVTTDTPIKRIFYDSSIELPILPRNGVEDAVDAAVMRYWKLYRYRFFAQTMVTMSIRRGLGELTGRAFAQQPPALPPEAQKFFDPIRVSPASYAIWERWRQS